MSSPRLPGGTNIPNINTPENGDHVEDIENSVETILADPLKHFVESLDIEKLWKGEDYNTILDTDEKIKRFKNEFKEIVLIMQSFKEFILNREDIKSLFNHDSPTLHSIEFYESLDGFVSYYAEMRRDYMRENIEFFIKNITYSKKIFLSFIESLYFTLNIDEKLREEKKRTLAIGKILELSIGDQDSIETSLDDTGVEIHGNIGDLIIFLRNIIRNAQKHNTPKGMSEEESKENRGKARILINTQVIGDTIKIIIQDNGSGIPESMLPHIFEKGVSGGESSGLGLRDLEKRGIKAEASNNGLPNDFGGKGACFTIILPVKKEA